MLSQRQRGLPASVLRSAALAGPLRGASAMRTGPALAMAVPARGSVMRPMPAPARPANAASRGLGKETGIACALPGQRFGDRDPLVVRHVAMLDADAVRSDAAVGEAWFLDPSILWNDGPALVASAGCPPSGRKAGAFGGGGFGDTTARRLEWIDGKTGGHAFLRHGAQTTLAQQKERATSGMAPDGHTSRQPPNSTRFLTHQDHARAYLQIMREFRKRGSPQHGLSISVKMPGQIGEGYYAGGETYGRTDTVRAYFRDGKLYTMFPDLPDLDE